MKSLLSIAIVCLLFFVGCFACAPHYDSAQWAKNVKPKKQNFGCLEYQKPKRKKGRR